MGTEPMFAIDYTRLDGQNQTIASCASHIHWTMKQLGTRRAVIHSVNPAEYDCKGCLDSVEKTGRDVTIQLGTVKTGAANG